MIAVRSVSPHGADVWLAAAFSECTIIATPLIRMTDRAALSQSRRWRFQCCSWEPCANAGERILHILRRQRADVLLMPPEWVPGGRDPVASTCTPAKNYTTGCHINAGGANWICASSRDVKRDFETVDVDEVLRQVSRLPMQKWRSINEDAAIRHLGPMAQDFRAAFLGTDDRTIATVDENGVALAAVQAQNKTAVVDGGMNPHYATGIVVSHPGRCVGAFRGGRRP